ncbi:MAG: translational GTPase TypA [Ruminococcaceae bacterium]|nr:translational GTPase TypA [Oscillospiraceae bacterium]
MICEKLRNVAIIAHVDHGKTTLVNEMLKQGGVFRENQVVADRVMDSNDLERERGITILAKNTAVHYKDVKINIIDTPGHADFGGEVERILKMVNGVILLVDAFEGPMPQTRFVLQKALDLGHRIIIVVNKIDRPDARPDDVVNEVLELLLDLDATEEQLESPVIFASARAGTASLSPDGQEDDLRVLFDTVVDYIQPPEGDDTAPLQMLVSAIDYNDYVGRIAIGRVERGTIKQNQDIVLTDWNKQRPDKKAKAVNIYTFDGLGRKPVTESSVGDVICVSGIEDVNIGDTICAATCVEALPFVKITDPTMEMTFMVNDSPYAGREGKFVTSRNLRERLFRELLKDVSLRVEETDTTEAFRVCGRGEMHLSILIENMRREGYEFQVSTPRVLFKEIDGVQCEPVERVIMDVPETSMGAVMEKMGIRKGEFQHMSNVGNRTRLEFIIPSRGLFGYRSEFMTDTRGEGIINSIFEGYAPFKGDIPRRDKGSLVAYETGEATTYGIFNVQDLGVMFVDPQDMVYAGQIVGEALKSDEITVNVCKKKHMTAIRSAGKDEALRLVPPRKMSLEQALEFIADDELVEVTPKSMRLRKKILNHDLRMKQLMRSREK